MTAPPVAALGAVLLSTAVGAWLVTDIGRLTLPTDDAYIYLGYVKRTFAEDGGLFSYNPAERSAGTTGIAYYLLSALAAAPWALVLSDPALFEIHAWVLGTLGLALCSFLVASRLKGFDTTVSDVGSVPGTRAIAPGLFSCLVLAGHPDFLWGCLSGMENPLSAALAIGLCISVRDRRAIGTGALSAALAATRPETLPLVALLPLTAGLPRGDARPRPAAATISLAVFALGVGAVVGLLYTSTGQWHPTSLGARVSLRAATSPAAVAEAARSVVLSEHGIASLLGILLLWTQRHRSELRGAIWIPIAIVVFLVTRQLLGLNAGVRDRYVSYLWAPLVWGVLPALWLVLLRPAGHRKRWATVLFATVLALSGTGVAVGASRIASDAREMDQVVVRPSLWMARTLPQDATVAMEPAGAIRLFTSFTLVDRVGLTTTHLRQYLDRGPERLSYSEFFASAGVDYVFDYPAQLRMLVPADQLEIVKLWRPRPRIHSGGPIALMRFFPHDPRSSR